MMTLTLPQLRAWLSAFARDVLDDHDRLNALDAATGDGEHGSNLARGAAAIHDALAEDRDEDIATLLRSVGMAIVNSVGGASGALYGTLFLRLSDHGSGRDAWSTNDLHAAFGDALRAMCELGRVREGDRTLIDALAPAVAQLSTHRDAPVAESCEAAALAAAAGAQRTAQLKPRAGRGAYASGRAGGHVDAGAASMSLLFAALSRATCA